MDFKKLFRLPFIFCKFLLSDRKVKNVSKGLVTAKLGKTYLFKSVQEMINHENKKADKAGWNIALYKGTNDGFIIESTNISQELELPLKLNGYFKVYIGYISGTHAFIVKETGKDNLYNYVGNNIKNDLDKLYGQQYIYEKRVLISNFSGNSIKICPCHNCRIRIAYIKLVGMTSQEIAAYNTPPEGDNGKRVIYDFDGYSGFFSGFYPDIYSLKERTIGALSNKNIGEINWCLGTTGMLNYNSKFAGKAFEDVDKYSNQLRKGDKIAIKQILNTLKSGKSPLEIIADEAEKKGIKVNASLRMDAFYNPKIYGFLNGSMYDKYKDCLQNGSFFMSYKYAKFRNYIKNILKEVATFENVDGITLDFCRYPTVMGSETVQVQKSIIMNQFMKEIRSEILSNKTIMVRIPYKNPLSYGLDVKTWVKEGYIDRLIPSNVGKDDFFDITPYVNMVKGTKVKLGIGINADVKGHDITKEEEELIEKGFYVHKKEYLNLEQYLLRAYEVYKKGADGIFLFNTSPNILSPIEGKYLGNKVLIQKWYDFEYNKREAVRKEKVFITKGN